MFESADSHVDARDLRCPMPLLKAKRALNALAPGQSLAVMATDAGSARDFAVFCEQSGHELLGSDQQNGVFHYLLRKR